MKVRTLALGLGAALALAACASGSSRNGGDRDEPIRALMSADVMMFVGFDGDGDLATSSAEIDAGLGREFARADTSRDGQLQPLEFQTWANAALGGGQMGPYRLDFDRNVDNIITREEFDAEIRARVSDYDNNSDAALSRAEFIRLIGIARPPVERPRRQVLPPSR